MSNLDNDKGNGDEPLEYPSLSDLKLRKSAPVEKSECPMAFASELIGDKWTMLILREAFYKVGCFADIQADLEISKAVLAERLARLIEQGLLEKITYQDPGSRPRQAYILTQSGRELLIPFLALADWGQRLTGKASPLEIFDHSTGKTAHITLVNDMGEPVPMDQMGVRLAEKKG